MVDLGAMLDKLAASPLVWAVVLIWGLSVLGKHLGLKFPKAKPAPKPRAAKPKPTKLQRDMKREKFDNEKAKALKDVTGHPKGQ